MDLEKGFLGGFLVLGVTVFVAGFLVGMLFLGTIHVSSDTAIMELMSFILGLITGMLTIALVFVVAKAREIPRARSAELSLHWLGVPQIRSGG